MTGLPSAITTQGEAISTFNATYGGVGWGLLLSSLAVASAVGLLVEFLANRFMRRRLVRPDGLTEPTLKQAFSFLTTRALRDLLGLVLFYAAALITLH